MRSERDRGRGPSWLGRCGVIQVGRKAMGWPFEPFGDFTNSLLCNASLS